MYVYMYVCMYVCMYEHCALLYVNRVVWVAVITEDFTLSKVTQSKHRFV